MDLEGVVVSRGRPSNKAGAPSEPSIWVRKRLRTLSLAARK